MSFRQTGLLAILLIWFGSLEAGEVFYWTNCGGNPSGEGHGAIELLDVPKETAKAWRAGVDSVLYGARSPEIVYVHRGDTLMGMTAGGKIPGTKFHVIDLTVCDWKDYDSLEADVYRASFLLEGDTLREVWTLLYFHCCTNIAYTYELRYVPPPVAEEAPPPEEMVITTNPNQFFLSVPRIEEKKKIGFWFEPSAWLTGGYVNTKGNNSVGLRLTGGYRITNPSAVIKLTRSGIPGYEGKAGGVRGIGLQSLIPLHTSYEAKGGVSYAFLAFDYAYVITSGLIGRQWFNGELKDGRVIEGEVIILRRRIQAELVDVNYSGAFEYNWFRVKIKRIMGDQFKKVRFRLGAEWYLEGDSDIFNPEFYATRGGLNIEWFRLLGTQSGNWMYYGGSLGWGKFHSGGGHLDSGFYAEVNLGASLSRGK